MAVRIAAGLALLGGVAALDNGLAILPPMGWRSWNYYSVNISQEIIRSQAVAFVDQSRQVDGKNTSLRELGYAYVGIDDGWMLCNSGPGGVGYHDAAGNPIIDLKKFPDLKGLGDYIHSQDLKMGWYLNADYCRDLRPDPKGLKYIGDVNAIMHYGFDAIKVDEGGTEKNHTRFIELINATGTPILQLYSHAPKTNETYCPCNYHGISLDIVADWKDVARCLHDMIPWTKWDAPLSRPGCWAHPDMLEVGNIKGPRAYTESRSHFGAWCIVSAPLYLGFDMANATVMDSVWDIISNTEAIAVNQQWHGHPGHMAVGPGDDSSPEEVWIKPLAEGRMAVLVINMGEATETFSVDLAQLRLDAGARYHRRNVWTHSDEGSVQGGFEVKLTPHDSYFIILEKEA